jgi:hypothetical protein
MCKLNRYARMVDQGGTLWPRGVLRRLESGGPPPVAGVGPGVSWEAIGADCARPSVEGAAGKLVDQINPEVEQIILVLRAAGG